MLSNLALFSLIISRELFSSFIYKNCYLTAECCCRRGGYLKTFQILPAFTRDLCSISFAIKMKFVKFCKKEKVWSGLKHQPTYNPNVSLGYLILNEFKKTPERITQVSADTGVQVTCFEMRQRSIKIVKHLQSLDLKQGDVVGIMGVNSEHLAAVVFACFTLGLPINSLAPIMVEGDIIHMYSKTKPKVIFCDSDVVETVQSSVNKIACIKPLIYTFLEKVEGYGFVDDILSVKDDGEEFT